MSRRLSDGERLVDGLNHHERIVRLERAVNGDRGLVDTDENLRRRLEELESQVRRLSLPFYLRWATGLRVRR